MSPDAAWHFGGVNLLPFVTGENKNPPHEALYWRFGAQIALRKGDWKIVKAPDQEGKGGGAKGAASTEGAQLHNLRDDIGEKTDLATARPEKLKELTDAWNAWNATLVAPKWGQVERKAGKGKKKKAR